MNGRVPRYTELVMQVSALNTFWTECKQKLGSYLTVNTVFIFYYSHFSRLPLADYGSRKEFIPQLEAQAGLQDWIQSWQGSSSTRELIKSPSWRQNERGVFKFFVAVNFHVLGWGSLAERTTDFLGVFFLKGHIIHIQHNLQFFSKVFITEKGYKYSWCLLLTFCPSLNLWILVHVSH